MPEGMRQFRFLIQVTVPLKGEDAMNARMVKDFILEAVQSWGGQCCPGDEENDRDPRFAIAEHPERVKVFG